MGKPTGFLEYSRMENMPDDPAERAASFQEFHRMLPDARRREQGARCMNCGVPFCQSSYGCPLHNLIPEWNDEIFSGNWSHALSRLMKTNRFPEFTGRVCPALCENACICGMEDIHTAVTVRENELAIAEYAWAHGLIRPEIPAVRTEKKVAVIGSGPAGLSVADRLNRRGHSVTVYERDELPGGLLMFGIPEMKLEKAVVQRRIEKMQEEGIVFQCGIEAGQDIQVSRLLKEYDALVLACGARQARSVPAVDHSVPGVSFALDYLSESTRALLEKRESRISASGLDVLVVGNGDTATDCVATALRQGAKSVHQLVRKPKAIPDRTWPYRPSGERTSYGQEEAIALLGEDPRLYEATVQKLITDENSKLREVQIRQGKEERVLPAGMILLASGFSGVEKATVDAFRLKTDEKGRIGGEDFTTEHPKIFACGDARRGPSLVVWAIADGRECARTVDRFLEGYTNL